MTEVEKTKRDPRFFRVKPKSHKVQVDERFKSALRKSASTSVGRRAKVDKYGRPVIAKGRKDTEDLRRYYQLSDDDDSSSSDALSETSEANEASDLENEDYSTDEAAIQEKGEEDRKEAAALGDATRRLAIVGLDWDQIKAQDIFVLVHGFKPPTGSILTVRILPSEFGRERMAQEALHGPQIVMEGEASSEQEDPTNLNRTIYEENLRLQNEERGYSDDAVRKYQLERLRYYFAVVECDSVATAAHIYRECDGREFELSANVLDMRYVPDEMQFDLETTKDYCDSLPLPGSYHAKTAIVTSALQNTRVKLTWDDDDIDRKIVFSERAAKKKGKKRTREESEEDNLNTYLASASSDEEDVDDASAERLQALARAVNEPAGSGSDSDGVYGRKRRKDLGFEIAFRSAFDEQVPKELSSKSEEREFSFQVETKQASSKKAQLFSSDEEKEKTMKTTKEDRKKSRKGRKEKKSAEDVRQTNSLRSVLLPETGGKDNAEIDVEDARFKRVYDDADFAIDPSHKAFRPTPGMRAIQAQRKRRFFHSTAQ